MLLPSHLADTLPDDLPGQSNCGESSFSYFSADSPAATPASGASSPLSTQGSPSGFWTGGNPAISGLSLSGTLDVRPTSSLTSALAHQSAATSRGAEWGATASPLQQQAGAAPRLQQAGNKGVLNEVVCGTLMLAYERAGMWEQVSYSQILNPQTLNPQSTTRCTACNSSRVT